MGVPEFQDLLGMVAYIFNSQRQAHQYEFEANKVHISSSRPVRVTL